MILDGSKTFDKPYICLTMIKIYTLFYLIKGVTLQINGCNLSCVNIQNRFS